MKLDDCDLCGQKVNGEGPAVGLAARSKDATWIPFVEDLRTAGYRLIHPVCFAEREGLEALLDVVHAHDRRIRAELADLLARLQMPR